MLLGLNGQSTLATLEKDLEAAERNGYQYIEIPVSKLKKYLQEHSIGELVSFFENSSLKPYSLNAITMISFRSEEEEKALIKEVHEIGSLAQAIQCPYIVICPSNNIDNTTREQIHIETVRVLRKMSDVVAQYDVGLAFEFLGFQNCTVNNLGQAYDIIMEVDRDNIGLSIDTFHFYENSRLEDLRKINKNKIFVFHINDAEDMPKEKLTDADRILPGLGVIPLRQFLQALKKTGYNHMASIELFRPEYYEWDPLELARRAKEATEAVLTEA